MEKLSIHDNDSDTEKKLADLRASISPESEDIEKRLSDLRTSVGVENESASSRSELREEVADSGQFNKNTSKLEEADTSHKEPHPRETYRNVSTENLWEEIRTIEESGEYSDKDKQDKIGKLEALIRERKNFDNPDPRVRYEGFSTSALWEEIRRIEEGSEYSDKEKEQRISEIDGLIRGDKKEVQSEMKKGETEEETISEPIENKTNENVDSKSEEDPVLKNSAEEILGVNLESLKGEEEALQRILARAKMQGEDVVGIESLLRENKSSQSFFRREQMIESLKANEASYSKKIEEAKEAQDVEQTVDNEQRHKAASEARIFAEGIQRYKREMYQVSKKIQQAYAKGDKDQALRLRAHYEALRSSLYANEDEEERMISGSARNKVEDKSTGEASDDLKIKVYQEGTSDELEKENHQEESKEKEFLVGLGDAREVFARSEVALEKDGLKGQRINDIGRAEEAAYAEHAYRNALKRERQALTAGLEGSEGREDAIKEALLKTTVAEAMTLYDTKTDIKNQERTGGFPEAVMKKVQKVEKWYRGLKPRNKLLIAGALFATAGAGALAGGVIGAGLAGAALTGKTMQRLLAGAGTGVALESFMKKSQMSREKKVVEKAFGEGKAEAIMAHFEKGNTALDDALLKIESKEGRRRARRYVLAATGGGLLASGAASSAVEFVGEQSSGLVGALRERFGWAPALEGVREPVPGVSAETVSPSSEDLKIDIGDFDSDNLFGVDSTPTGEVGPSLGRVGGEQLGNNVVEDINSLVNDTEAHLPKVGESLSRDVGSEHMDGRGAYVLFDGIEPTSAAETIPGIENHTVVSGDNMYRILEQNFSEIASLDDTGRNNAIENILAVVKENPVEFGIGSGDINRLSVGDSINLEKIQEILETERIGDSSIIERAEELSSNASGVVEQPLSEPVSVESTESVNSTDSLMEEILSSEAYRELYEFFRQTPGYLDYDDAQKHFLGMVERGDITAESLRLFEDRTLTLGVDRYGYEFDVLKEGEGIHGSYEHSNAEVKLKEVFNRLWGKPVE